MTDAYSAYRDEKRNSRIAFGEFIAERASQFGLLGEAAIRHSSNVAVLIERGLLTNARATHVMVQRACQGTAASASFAKLAILLGFGDDDRLNPGAAMWAAFLRYRSARKEARFESEGRRLRLPTGAILKDRTNGLSYRVGELIRQGGTRGDSYRGTIVGQTGLDARVFIRTVHLHASPRKDELSRDIPHFLSFLDAERRTLQRLADMSELPVAHFVGDGTVRLDWRGKRYDVPFSVQRFVDGNDLLEWTHTLRAPGDVFTGIVDAELYFKTARQMLRMLSQLHDRSVYHGAVRPDNFRVGADNTLFLIDFTQAGLHRRSERGPDEYEPRTRQGHEARPPSATDDAWGAAATLLYLATGSSPKALARVKGTKLHPFDLRDAVAAKIPPRLQAHNAAIVPVISSGLQSEPPQPGFDVHGMLWTLDAFDRMHGRSEAIGVKPEHHAAALGRSLRRTERRSPLFYALLERDVHALLAKAHRAAADGWFEVSGDRTRLVQGMVDFLSELRPRDRYLTRTTSTFWGVRNISPKGRFWEANRVLLSGGVCIQRIIAVSKKDLKSPSRERELRSILEGQAELAALIPKDGPGSDGFIRVRQYPDDDSVRAAVDHGHAIGLIVPRDRPEGIALSFQMDHDEVLTRIRVWNMSGPDMTAHVNAFAEMTSSTAETSEVRRFLDNWQAQRRGPASND